MTSETRTGLALLCALLAVSACQREGSTPQKAAAPPPLPVSVKSMTIASVPIAIDAVGRAEGSREVEVRARVSGILQKRYFAEGHPVRAGQTLFLIERASYELAAQQARAALSQERVRFELAQREADRLKSLAQNRAISQREYDEAAAAAKQTRAAIEGAQAKLAEAELNLSYTEVKAPIGGITSRAARSEGSLVAANTDLLATITQVDPIWIAFSVAEADFERVRGAGKQARVQLLDNGGTPLPAFGVVNFTGSTVDAKLGTVQLRAEVRNDALQRLPGQFVPVRLLAGEQQAYLVPQAAVVQQEQARMVWVVGADNTAALKPVKTANWIGDQWVVTQGLQPGDKVIVDNLIKLKPGARVEPREAEPRAARGAEPQGAPQPAAR